MGRWSGGTRHRGPAPSRLPVLPPSALGSTARPAALHADRQSAVGPTSRRPLRADRGTVTTSIDPVSIVTPTHSISAGSVVAQGLFSAERCRQLGRVARRPAPTDDVTERVDDAAGNVRAPPPIQAGGSGANLQFL